MEDNTREVEERNRREREAFYIGVIPVIALVAAISIFGAYFGIKTIASAAAYSVDESAKVECVQWAAEASKHSAYSAQNPGGYYLTKWQDEECRSVGIHVQAPVI